ncbi:DoxX family protein [Flavobacteriaceae bacterium KMM 6897]|nr:DoxX family protein [Flavobacteriaceae bacterium KMM 6897]MEB8346269.1 DoxX family protein [Flavobacteriaceae bacterium KMM 6898]
MEHITNNATEILLLFFLLITFLQSGIDKLVDWRGNLSWLTGHFAESPLKNMVPVLLGVVVVTEMIAGILSAIGLFQIATAGESQLAFYSAIVSCVALLMLLFGQRIAKDYEGAKTIAVYFIPAIFLVFLLQA